MKLYAQFVYFATLSSNKCHQQNQMIKQLQHLRLCYNIVPRDLFIFYMRRQRQRGDHSKYDIIYHISIFRKVTFRVVLGIFLITGMSD